MDTQKECAVPEWEGVPDLSGGNVIVGAKQLRKALRNGVARRVFLARDADPAIVLPIAQACRDAHIEFAWIRSMKDLGRACGIEVGAAAAAVVDD